MDLNLSDSQRELRSGLRDFLADTWTPDRLRAAADAPGATRKEWRALAELGVFGLLLSDEQGGLGLGWADAAVLFEELGRALAPGPLTATLLAATFVPDAVPGAVDGQTPVTAVDTRDPYAIVEHPGADTRVVLVDDTGLFLLQSPPDTSCAAHPLDPLTPVAPLDATQAHPGAGTRIGTAEDAAQWRRAGALLTAALQVGVGQGALDLAVRYAGEREQFGRPIGSFQAVKHLLAEALVKVDLARAAVLVAGVELDGLGTGDPHAAVAAAKVLADDAATGTGRTGIQVHGGMGFTWEVLAHLHLKRAWLLETAYGSAGDSAVELAETLERRTGGTDEAWPPRR